MKEESTKVSGATAAAPPQTRQYPRLEVADDCQLEESFPAGAQAAQS